ncbi:MAG: T9SS C-terminal target domain-containing protein [Balneolaceae bacterium]|nr:MAG: T9SS C-terminal target domain-containing protein [Balneolaceae bacterium]
MYRFVYLIFTFLLLFTSAEAQVVINEIQASNGSTFFDEDGEAEDWIELYNNGSETVSLNGFGLSDDYDNPFRWTIPNVSIEPGGYLLIWASGKDRTSTASELHTNFSISSDGEEIILTRPDGTRMDEIPPIPIPRDISYGRYPDGSDQFYFFEEPTPGSQNGGERYQQKLSRPQFSHEGGAITSSIQLILTSPEGADIYFTLDGSEPIAGQSSRYTGPLPVNRSLMVRARAASDSALESEVKSAIFNYLSPQVANFSSNLPLVIINQYNTTITPGDRSPGAITFIDTDGSGRAQLAAEDRFQSRMKINKRGSSSLSFPKNMFGFHLQDEDNTNLSSELLGLPPDHNWILYAPYTDMTLMRNVVAYQLAEDTGWYAPRTRFVELYKHTGSGPVTRDHYHGVYVLTERIKWSDDRVNITQIAPGDISEPEITGGYIIKKDRLNEGESGFRTRRGTRMAHARPQEADISPEQQRYIRDYISDFEDALYGPNFDDPNAGYENYIDVDSFIDHFLVTELLKEIDGYRLSTFMYKDRGGKLVMGPVWDFNLSIGIADYLAGWEPTGWYYPEASNDCFVGCGVRDWYVRLMKDENYRQRMNERWWQLRQGVFSNSHLMGLINDNYQLLQEAQVRNFERWPTLGTYVWPNWYVGQTYRDEVDWMKNWLRQRVNWMDRQMGDPIEQDTPLLKYYWYFGDSLPNNTPLETISVTKNLRQNAFIEFQSSLDGYPFDESHPNWREASMERRNRPTDINYRREGNQQKEFTADDMRALQVRQPFRGDAGENKLILHLPTAGYREAVLSFAAMDEGAAERLLIDYSVSDGEPQWTTSGMDLSEFDLSDEFQLYEIDFRSNPETNNSLHFKVRIRFDGDDLTANDGDRVTFNNISLDVAGPIRIGPDPSEIPQTIELNQNYPNPFNSGTIINYRLPRSNFVTLEVFDLLGRRIATLADGFRDAGSYDVPFDASGLSSGVYIYRLITNNEVLSRKMVLIK